MRSLIDKQQLVVLGLNSGTSADGLDLAAVKIMRSESGVRTKFLAGKTKNYPAKIRELVLSTIDAPEIAVDKLIYLDNALGQFYGRAAAGFVKELKAKRITVHAVASHGQTIRHLPEKAKLAGFSVRGTLQIGSLDHMAVATGLPVIGDFRQADIAVGNEGAPITVAAMERLMSHETESRLIVNIGGMSNYFYFPANSSDYRVQAADCGPGNVLCDLLAERLFDKKYDRGGKLAKAGTVSRRLLSLLLAEPFFGNKTTSTGREVFGTEMADRMVVQGSKLKLLGNDLVATAAELTVSAIARSISRIIARDKRVRKLYLTGGGAHNTFIRERLADLLDLSEVTSVSAIGFDPDLVEASAFAVMGEGCLRSEPMRTRFDGKSSQRLMPVPGRIVQPPRKA